MRAWLVSNIPPDNAAPAPESVSAGEFDTGKSSKLGHAKTASQIRVNIERAANLKLDRLIREGHYIKRELVDDAAAAKWLAHRKLLEQLPGALRQVFADASDPLQCEEILATALRRVCNAVMPTQPTAKPPPGFTSPKA
jgi:hypothetical protein